MVYHCEALLVRAHLYGSVSQKAAASRAFSLSSSVPGRISLAECICESYRPNHIATILSHRFLVVGGACPGFSKKFTKAASCSVRIFALCAFSLAFCLMQTTPRMRIPTTSSISPRDKPFPLVFIFHHLSAEDYSDFIFICQLHATVLQ